MRQPYTAARRETLVRNLLALRERPAATVAACSDERQPDQPEYAAERAGLVSPVLRSPRSRR